MNEVARTSGARLCSTRHPGTWRSAYTDELLVDVLFQQAFAWMVISGPSTGLSLGLV